MLTRELESTVALPLLPLARMVIRIAIHSQHNDNRPITGVAI
jgi:hypothetical protein